MKEALRNTTFKYDICLSFAGEDRPYVEKVANALRQRGVRVFYDDYEKAQLWGKNLYTHLGTVYHSSARFCIMFISSHYAKKLWANHERECAQARAFEENKEYILPARFDNTEIPGVLPTIGYIDLQRTLPTELASLIIDKLGMRPREDGDASSSLSHTQRVLDTSLNDILTELPHVTHGYEFYSIIRSLPYIYPVAMRVREFVGQAKQPSELLSMVDSIIVDTWSEPQKDTLGILANLLSTQNEFWSPNKSTLSKINSLCLRTLSNDDYSQIGIMAPLVFAVGRKGLRSTHRKFLQVSIEANEWRNADIEHIGKYYETQEIQLSSIDRYWHDKLRTGLLRVNDFPRLIYYLTNPSVKLTTVLNTKARQLTSEFLTVLRECREDKLLRYVQKELLEKRTNCKTLF